MYVIDDLYYLLGSYANIYLKEGIMQNKVPKFNILLRLVVNRNLSNLEANNNRNESDTFQNQ